MHISVNGTLCSFHPRLYSYLIVLISILFYTDVILM